MKFDGKFLQQPCFIGGAAACHGVACQRADVPARRQRHCQACARIALLPSEEVGTETTLQEPPLNLIRVTEAAPVAHDM